MHTIRPHGTTLARSHKHDWFIVLFLVLIEIILNIIHPFYRFVGKDMMPDLKYPMKENTVPVWAVAIYAVLLSIIVFNLFYIWRRSVYDLHHSILGLLFAVLITGVLADSVKLAAAFLMAKIIATLVGSFTGLGFLSLYLAGKIRAFDSRGHVVKLCIVFLPLLAAAPVGVSRVDDDYRHHWQDVFAGVSWGLSWQQFVTSHHPITLMMKLFQAGVLMHILML